MLHPEIEQQLPLAAKTIPEYLKSAGYTSACVGKWHLGGKGFDPVAQGFDVAYTMPANTKPSATEGREGRIRPDAQGDRIY